VPSIGLVVTTFLSVSRLDSSAGILFSVFGDARAGLPRSGFVHRMRSLP